MRVLRAFLCSLLACVWLAAAAPAADERPQLAPGKAYRGVAVLSSSIGHDVPADEIEAFAKTCKLDLVVVDFAWITHHFPRTDLKAVEDVAQRLAKLGIVVAAMYRPRLLSPDATVHAACDENGVAPSDHADLCFAHQDSVGWGAAWGEKILAACPSIDHVVLYNLRAPCRCADCKDGAGARHAEEFVGTCRTRWSKVRAGVRVGHVGNGLEYLGGCDFVLPFLPVNREDAATPPDVAALADASSALRAEAGGKPFVPLAKVCWEQATQNTTADVVAVVKACDERKLGFVLWTYDWLFHPDGERYDPDALVRALGGDPGALAKFLHPAPAATTSGAAAPDGRQWVSFDSREKPPGPALVLVSADGKETLIAAEADTNILSYLPKHVLGGTARLSLNLADTSRTLVRFPNDRMPAFQRAELRLSMHLSEIPPAAPFDVTVHAIEDKWDERAVSWSTAPPSTEKPAATATIAAKEGEVRVDITPLVREWAAKPKRNHGLVLKSARAVPEGTGPLVLQKKDPATMALRGVIARWKFETSPADALAKAKADGKPVVAVVVAGNADEALTPHEEMLFSTALSHPAVIDLVTSRFVALRMAVPAARFAAPGGRDPLTDVGTNAAKAGAPALVVVRPDGTCAATLASIGTFDHALVLEFLRDALAAAGGEKVAHESDPSALAARPGVDGGIALMRLGRLDEAAKSLQDSLAAAGARASEASYWLAAVLAKRGDDAASRAILEKLVRGDAADPWTAKAAMRLGWPVRVGALENLVAPPSAATRSAGVADAAARGGEFLLREQRPDGSWKTAHGDYSDADAGITSLAAHALLVWRDDAAAGQKERVGAALRKADAWLVEHAGKAVPRDLNSFAAAYYVEYLLDRMTLARGSRDDVTVALRQLVGGVCPSGSWSYSLAFGENWRGNERTHSVNAALAVEALLRAKKAGFAVDTDALAGGVKALLAMKAGPAAYTYTWPGKPSFEEAECSIARAPICDHALLAAGRVKKEDLRGTLDVFMKLRSGLKATGRTSTSYWLPPNAYTSYFFHFAYYHAADALAAVGDAQSKTDLAQLRDELVSWAEPDGAWVDDLNYGKAYGTAAALLTLRVAGTALEK